MIVYTYVATMILSLLGSASSAYAFRTTERLPVRIESIPKSEIRHRLGLKETDSQQLKIGEASHQMYGLSNEHEVLCPVSGTHRGVLCTARLDGGKIDLSNAESLANHGDLVSQSILAASLATSVRNTAASGSGMYYLPFVVTLVESLVANEIGDLNLERMTDGRLFNSDGLETNEILLDFDEDYYADTSCLSQDEVLLFSCNTSFDSRSASSDVYILPQGDSGNDKVWKFGVEFKVATINLAGIKSFGRRDSTTPLRPDVWLKDDYY